MTDLHADDQPPFRPTIEQGHTHLRIINPLATSQQSKLHLTALLIVWILGAAFSLTALVLGKRILGPAFIHVGWLGVGIPVLWAYSRFAIGSEVITFRENSLTISRRPIPLGYRRKYDLSKARHFRVDTTGLRVLDGRHRRNPLRWRGEQGLILFDYGLKPVRFGVGLSTAEAREILKVVRKSGRIDSSQVSSDGQ